MVQQIPLNDRGKLDRNSLPDFATLKNEEPEEPSFTSECKLLAPILYIWKEVLDLETLTPDQSIFEIGMHSLQATQITARIYEKLGIRVDLTNLFDHPTPRELSTFLDKNLI
ncbi:MAG: phosphopantetheine-binding protein [Gammaproteobacteria bacterium]